MLLNDDFIIIVETDLQYKNADKLDIDLIGIDR